MKSYHAQTPTANRVPNLLPRRRPPDTDIPGVPQIRRLEHSQFARDRNSPLGAVLSQLRVNLERLGRDKPVPASAWVLLAKQIVAAGGGLRP